MNKKTIKIGNRLIGAGQKPYVIAELSANHNGTLENALKMIQVAANCGADAVKLQTYTADTLTIDSDRDEFYIRGGLWDGMSLYQLYKKAQTPYEWHPDLFAFAKKVGITCFSTPFDETAVDLLESLDVPAYKVASFEITDFPLIRYIAKTRKPMIISTGMATESEIAESIAEARNAGCNDLVLLHCISEYPAPIEKANLMRIRAIAEKFDVIVGLSDHTLGTVAAVASVAIGSAVIEKHFTLNRNDSGPDSSFSIEPPELKRLCIESKEAWQALGRSEIQSQNSENINIQFRRSIYFVKKLKAGSIIGENDVRCIRPANGLAPKYLSQVLGKKLKTDVDFGTPTSWDLFAE